MREAQVAAIKEFIKNNKSLFPQRQDSTDDQLYDLIWLGNQFGLYDAVDCVKIRFDIK